jgi:hypothetical protein
MSWCGSQMSMLSVRVCFHCNKSVWSMSVATNGVRYVGTCGFWCSDPGKAKCNQ